MEGPGSPYREGKPLTALIPPDRRRQKTVILVVASMIAGALLWQLAVRLLERPAATKVAEPPAGPRDWIAKTVLRGPDGAQAIPPESLAVVHVWLQGCSDCMPAFEAMRAIDDAGGLGVDAPVFNVAYGEADPAWASRYGVRENLVFDPGGARIVRPLGIGTFTTLVVDETGVVVHRDRPDRPGYVERVREAVAKHAPPRSDAPRGAPRLDAKAVERVVGAHRARLDAACWRGGARPPQAKVTVAVQVAPDGRVASAEGEGDDAEVAECVERQVRTWRFPAPGGRVDLVLPFLFARD